MLREMQESMAVMQLLLCGLCALSVLQLTVMCVVLAVSLFKRGNT